MAALVLGAKIAQLVSGRKDASQKVSAGSLDPDFTREEALMARTPLQVDIALDHIHCFKQSDWGSAEPYLWTIFFKIDGDTVTMGDDLFLHGPRPSEDFMVERDQLAAEEREAF